MLTGRQAAAVWPRRRSNDKLPAARRGRASMEMVFLKIDWMHLGEAREHHIKTYGLITENAKLK